jgi:hypothetical protein
LKRKPPTVNKPALGTDYRYECTIYPFKITFPNSGIFSHTFVSVVFGFRRCSVDVNCVLFFVTSVSVFFVDLHAHFLGSDYLALQFPTLGTVSMLLLSLVLTLTVDRFAPKLV